MERHDKSKRYNNSVAWVCNCANASHLGTCSAWSNRIKPHVQKWFSYSCQSMKLINPKEVPNFLCIFKSSLFLKTKWCNNNKQKSRIKSSCSGLVACGCTYLCKWITESVFRFRLHNFQGGKSSGTIHPKNFILNQFNNFFFIQLNVIFMFVFLSLYFIVFYFEKKKQLFWISRNFVTLWKKTHQQVLRSNPVISTL